MPFFCQNLKKMAQNLSSAAVVIGVLRVQITLVIVLVFRLPLAIHRASIEDADQTALMCSLI